MSNVLDRPRGSRPGSAAAARGSKAVPQAAGSVWLRGAMAAGWAVLVAVAAMIVVALVIWAADSRSSANAGGAMQFAVQLWLLAHRVPLRVPTGGALTIPPMALTLFVGALIARGAAILARTADCQDGRDVGVIAAAVAGPYAVMATVLALITPSASLRPSVAAAFLSSAVIAGIAAVVGAARGSGLAGPSWSAMPAETRAVLSATARSAGVLFGAAGLLALGSLVAHGHEFGAIAGDYNGGAGTVAMVMLSLLLVPNAICFGVGYITGPGFAVGVGTSVTYSGVHLGAIPAFPLLAAVPSGAAPWQVMALFIAAVVGAGAVAGLRVGSLADLALRAQVRLTLVTGAVLGIAVMAVVGFAGGPGGPGRLSAVGPSPWQVGVATAVEIAAVGSAAVLASHQVKRLRGTARP